MAESMKGLHRSHRCAEVVNAAIGSEVTVMGWVQKRRNLGGMIFIDLRDRSGLLQIVFDENDIGTEGYEKAGKLRSEFVIAVTGKLEKRGGAVNDNLATGELEVRAESLRILSESVVRTCKETCCFEVKWQQRSVALWMQKDFWRSKHRS